MSGSKGFGWGSKGGGGALATGILQLQGGVPLDTTLRNVADQAGTLSPLQLSTTQVNFTELTTLTKSGGIIASGIVGLNRFVGLYADNDPAIVYSASNGLRIATVSNISAGGFSERARFDNNGNFVLGTTTASARLHVRGDGTNPIARFENSAGSDGFLIASGGNIFESITNTINLKSQLQLGSGYIVNIAGRNTFASTNTTLGILTLENNFAAAAGSANFRPLNIAYTINNSGAQSGTATGIFLNATETALNGMTHNLMDLQVGGVSRFKVDNSGNATFVGAGGLVSAFGFIADGSSPGYFRWAGRSRMASNADSTITFTNSAGTDFNRLQLGGTTNAFPALRRNATQLDVVLADDSDYAAFRASVIYSNLEYRLASQLYITSPSDGIMLLRNNVGTSFNKIQLGGTTNLFPSIDRNGASIEFKLADGSGYAAIAALSTTNTTYIRNGSYGLFGSISAPNASAILQADSTTQGFLPPRMTTTQRDAISSPAAGLVIYNTTTNKLNVFTTAWEAVTSV